MRESNHTNVNIVEKVSAHLLIWIDIIRTHIQKAKTHDFEDSSERLEDEHWTEAPTIAALPPPPLGSGVPRLGSRLEDSSKGLDKVKEAIS